MIEIKPYSVPEVALSFSVRKTIEAIKKGDKVQEFEISEGQYWDLDSSTLDDYEEYFSHFSKGKSTKVITSFLEEKRRGGESIYILDIAGGRGRALRDLARRGLLQGGVNATLTDTRSEEEKAFDDSNNIHLVTGNLLRASTWRNIQSHLEAINPDGTVSLAVALPLAGLAPIEKEDRNKRNPRKIGLSVPPFAYQQMLGRAIGLLDHHRGMLLSQVACDISLEDAKDYFRRLSDYPGLTVKFDDNIVLTGDVSGEITWKEPRSKFDQGIIKIMKESEIPFEVT